MENKIPDKLRQFQRLFSVNYSAMKLRQLKQLQTTYFFSNVQQQSMKEKQLCQSCFDGQNNLQNAYNLFKKPLVLIICNYINKTDDKNWFKVSTTSLNAID